MLLCRTVKQFPAQNKKYRWIDNGDWECLKAEDRLDKTPGALWSSCSDNTMYGIMACS
jgi:surface antigen